MFSCCCTPSTRIQPFHPIHSSRVYSLQAQTDEDVNLRDVLKVMNPREILLYLICVFFYAAVFVFIQYGGGFFDTKWPSHCEPSRGKNASNHSYFDNKEMCMGRTRHCEWSNTTSTCKHSSWNTGAFMS